jgi:hypothetical protein
MPQKQVLGKGGHHNQKLQILCTLAARHHRHGAVSADCGQGAQNIHELKVVGTHTYLGFEAILLFPQPRHRDY